MSMQLDPLTTQIKLGSDNNLEQLLNKNPRNDPVTGDLLIQPSIAGSTRLHYIPFFFMFPRIS